MRYHSEDTRHWANWYLCAVMVTERLERARGCAPSAFLNYTDAGLERAICRLSRALDGDDWFLPHLEAAREGKTLRD